jgi:hypothetical protein
MLLSMEGGEQIAGSNSSSSIVRERNVEIRHDEDSKETCCSPTQEAKRVTESDGLTPVSSPRTRLLVAAKRAKALRFNLIVALFTKFILERCIIFKEKPFHTNASFAQSWRFREVK